MADYAKLVEALRDPERACNAWDAADAIEELVAELHRKQTIRARHKIRYDYDSLVKDTNIEKIIREKLMAQVFDLLFDKQNMYSMSKESLQDGSVLYELELSIMPPTEPKGVE